MQKRREADRFFLRLRAFQPKNYKRFTRKRSRMSSKFEILVDVNPTRKHPVSAALEGFAE